MTAERAAFSKGAGKANRFAKNKPGQTVAVLVALNLEVPDVSSRDRNLMTRRSRVVRCLAKASRPALTEIDRILDQYGGRRLAKVSALGTVPVQVKPAGVSALAKSKFVKAVLHDQPVTLKGSAASGLA